MVVLPEPRLATVGELIRNCPFVRFIIPDLLDVLVGPELSGNCPMMPTRATCVGTFELD